jgi:four helix bundle protein
MQDFKNLKVWQKSHELTLEIYKVTAKFPKEELFGLTSQIRRASSSISANIAEGCGRKSDADFARFLQNAIGSASETQNHLILAKDLGFIDLEKYEILETQANEVKRMLISFVGKLR